MLGLKKIIKREELEEEEEVEEAEETQDSSADEGEPIEEDVKEEKSDEDEIIEKMAERLNEIENKLPRLDISINGLRRDLESLRQEIQKIDDSMKDIMALYEVVSAQINPFVGSSKVTSLSVERIEALEKSIEEIEDQIRRIKMDLRIILRDSLNVKGIVEEVIYGGEFA